MTVLTKSSLPVENQDLRERLTFSVRTLVRDGQDFSIWRYSAHRNAYRFAASLFLRLGGPRIDTHGIQRVVASRTCHRIVPPVIFVGIRHLHRVALGIKACPGDQNTCRSEQEHPDLALPTRTRDKFRFFYIQLPGPENRIVWRSRMSDRQRQSKNGYENKGQKARAHRVS